MHHILNIIFYYKLKQKAIPLRLILSLSAIAGTCYVNYFSPCMSIADYSKENLIYEVFLRVTPLIDKNYI